MAQSIQDKIAALREYSACDVSDAVLVLQKTAPGEVARGGYLADIIPYAPSSPFVSGVTQPKVIAEVQTLKMVDILDKSVTPLGEGEPGAIPKGKHWVDLTEPGKVLVIEQPSHMTCASIGGIMGFRLKARGVAGVVSAGRVRDLAELRQSGVPIWATGRSTVGTNAESKPYARNIPITVKNVKIQPGDVIFADPLEGVVLIPQQILDEVLALMPKLVEADNKVMKDVVNGGNVFEAFKAHRL